jgi:hypothetical protein
LTKGREGDALTKVSRRRGGGNTCFIKLRVPGFRDYERSGSLEVEIVSGEQPALTSVRPVIPRYSHVPTTRATGFVRSPYPIYRFLTGIWHPLPVPLAYQRSVSRQVARGRLSGHVLRRQSLTTASNFCQMYRRSGCAEKKMKHMESSLCRIVLL